MKNYGFLKGSRKFDIYSSFAGIVN